MLVLHRFFKTVVPEHLCPLQVASMLALCSAVELLHGAPRAGSGITPGELQLAIVGHLKAYQSAYGAEGWVFKHHQSLHLPGMMAMHQGLLNCFMHERKHKTVKRWLKDRLNPQSYEKGVVLQLTIQHPAHREDGPEEAREERGQRLQGRHPGG